MKQFLKMKFVKPNEDSHPHVCVFCDRQDEMGNVKIKAGIEK